MDITEKNPLELDETARELIAMDCHRFKDESIARLNFQNEMAHSVLKNLLLINGGSVVSLLTFVGNTESYVDKSDIHKSFLFFIIASLMCILSYACAFFAGEKFHDATIDHLINSQWALRGLPPQENPQEEERTGKFWYRIVLLLVLLSLISFAFGAYFGLEAIS